MPMNTTTRTCFVSDKVKHSIPNVKRNQTPVFKHRDGISLHSYNCIHIEFVTPTSGLTESTMEMVFSLIPTIH